MSPFVLFIGNQSRICNKRLLYNAYIGALLSGHGDTRLFGDRPAGLPGNGPTLLPGNADTLLPGHSGALLAGNCAALLLRHLRNNYVVPNVLC